MLSVLLSTDSGDASLRYFVFGFFHFEVFEGIKKPLADEREITHFRSLFELLLEFIGISLNGNVSLNEILVQASVGLLAFGLLDFLYFNGEDYLVLEFDLC